MSPASGRRNRALPGVVSRWGRVAAFLVVAAACTDFEDLNVAPLHPEPAPDCELAHPPSPSIMTPAGVGNQEFVVACWHTDLGDSADGGVPGYETIGYDLDNACTTADAGFTCIEPAWAKASHVDGPGGRDNAIGAYAYQVNTVFGTSTSTLTNSAVSQGLLVVAIRVRGFNRIPADSAVVVDYYGAALHGLDSKAEGGPPVPRWDGSDQYDVLTTYLKPPEAGAAYDLDQPIYEDRSAYVTSGEGSDAAGILVSRIDSLLVGGTQLHLRHAIMTAEIVKTGNTWTLRNGTFAGSLYADEYLASLSHLIDVESQKPYCKDAGSYAQAKALLCAYTDIASSPSSDGGIPECDSLSFAWRFLDSANITLVGAVDPPPLPPDGCPPGRSLADDHCGL